MKGMTAAAALLFAAAAAWGRAGGGGGYSGGSSFSSGRSSFSSGSSSWGSSGGGGGGYYRRRYRRRYADGRYYDENYYTRESAPRGPIMGLTYAQEALLLLPIFVVGIAVLVARGRRRDQLEREGAISESFRAQQAQAVASTVLQLRQRDPLFDLQRFLAQARETFLVVQQAWSDGDMRPAASYITEGVRERFSAQLELNRREGRRNRMSDVRVHQVTVAQIEVGEGYEVIHARIDANAVDEDIDVATGRRIKGGRAEGFVEIWSFLRRGGDWLVSEITQAGDWTPRAPRQGAEYCAQELEDRASVVFWRWQVASAERSPDALRPAATAGLIQDFAPFECAEPAVGAARVVAYEPGRAHVELKWSGFRAGAHVFRHVITLKQENGVWLGDAITPAKEWKPPSERALVNGHDWASPLAPADALALMACALAADGGVTRAEREYLEDYARARRMPQDEAARILEAALAGRLDAPKPASGEEAETMLKGLIHASFADGALSEGEQALLNAFAARLSLPPRQLDAMIEEERRALFEKVSA